MAQIPSLLLAISTAIIVTRVSATHDMAENIGKQVSLSRAWIPVAGVLMLIGFVPGMPNIMFLAAALIAAGAGYWSFMREKELVRALSGRHGGRGYRDQPDQIELDEIADNAPISIQLGYGLIDLVSDDGSGALTSRVTGIRRQVSRALGFVIPPVRIRDDLTLDGNGYRIRVGSTIVGEDTIYPDRRLAIAGDDSRIKIDGVEVKDPSFGMDAIWIHRKLSRMQRRMAMSWSIEFVRHAPVVDTSQKASQLIGQDDVQLLDNSGQTAHRSYLWYPRYCSTTSPPYSYTSRGRRSVSDLRSILEDLASLSARNLSSIDTAEALRPRLAPLLIQQIAPLNQALKVMTLDSGSSTCSSPAVRRAARKVSF